MILYIILLKQLNKRIGLFLSALPHEADSPTPEWEHLAYNTKILIMAYIILQKLI